MNEPDPWAWLASIAEIFDRVGVEWAIVGALAANRYRATPRFTTDLDCAYLDRWIDAWELRDRWAQFNA